MRTLALTLLTTLTLSDATAAVAADLDYGVLRGPAYEPAAPIIDWNGVYIGGHAGCTATDFNFGKAGRSDLAQMLRSTAIEQQFVISQSNTLRPGVGHGLSFGGFAGFNYQFDETIVGLEADYTSLNQKTRSEDSLGRSVNLSNGLYDTYFVETKSRAALQDYATIRARGGAILGAFMPYITGGVAIGRAHVGNSVFVKIDEYTDQAQTMRVGSLDLRGGTVKEIYALGAALGAGIDYAVTQNIFLRGEYQYIWFDRFGDHKMELHTIRSALGLKF